MGSGTWSPDMIDSLEIDPRIKIREPKDLLETTRVVRVNAFDEDSVKAFSVSMSMAHRTGQPIIPVVIDSYGGYTYSLLAMIDIMKSSRVPVATIVQGKAMSCGAILFTCGTEGYRFMGPNATLMIHDVSAREPHQKSEEVQVSAKETDRLNRKMYSIMDKNCGHEPGYSWDLVQQRGRTDWYLSPKQAVHHRYANHIGVPKMTTKVIVEMTFDF